MIEFLIILSLYAALWSRDDVHADTQLVHADMKFDPNASPQCYRSNDEVIQKDTKVRVELLGCRVEADRIVSGPLSFCFHFLLEV